ncbi:hypothetical protein ACFDHY_06765 [Staphylococcus hyicus]|uniref:Phage protein n=1 Tax=Staphylococcus agnetis TaxID=985762 RepID=A0ABX3Z3N4_9STAP|nr:MULTISPECIES: hypothetical protein [Staphylococcus]AJC95783.1 hypothetical protein SHYC_05125 [Staphylococcus hyicus]MCQ9301397.1 hypothetical protein [Staphylococcus hyicus]MDG4943936.1 hypothetical protein [Staphylococcus agnetis]MDP4448319.1 hypothetical protein [Staphylococcus hyicus]MDP4459765.1 hypothetical protein [Staphylococcus hyicus]
MKYKVKKQMTLPELIQWGWDNEIENMFFRSSDGSEVHFELEGNFNTEEYIAFNETFEVEVEEEITEETFIPKLIEVYKNVRGESFSFSYSNKSINHVLNINELYQNRPTKAFYMLNDDCTMTLLWRNGEMVE